MINPVDLESLYAQAQAALKAKEYTRASALLRQIVAVDATYKDTSRLLANLVAQQRRRWYNDARVWSAAGVIVLVALGVLLAQQLPALLPRATETPTAIALVPTATATRAEPTATLPPSPFPSPTLTPVPSVTPTPSPTPAPFTWKRISLGQEFPLDVVMAIAVDPHDTDVMYAGGAYSGIFKSLDGGESWYPSHLGLERAAVDTLAIDPQDPRILYAGTSVGGVYKTTDGGEHWRAINQGMSISTWEWLSAVIIDPKDSRHLYYASDSRGPYESKDAGETWQRVKKSSCPDVKTYAFVMHPQDPKTLFWAATEDSSTCKPALYKSTDGGVNWTMTNLQDDRVGQNRALAIDGKDGNILFAYKSPPGRIFKSTDAGMNWTQLSHGGCRFIAIHPDNPDWVYCGDLSGALDQSMDGGQSWRRSDLGTRVLRAMTFFPQPSRNMLLGGQGVFLSTDSGNSWKSVSKGLGSVLMQLVLDPKQSGVLYAHETSCQDFKASHALFRSSDQGRTWQFATDQRCAFAFDADGTTLYGVTSSDNGEVARSQDGGRTWTKTSAMKYIASLTAHPYQKGMLFLSGGYATPYYLRFSTDGGSTWQNVSGISPSGNDYKLFFDHDQGQVVYAIGLYDPHYRSTDGGRSWTACGVTNASLAKDSDSRAVVDPRNSNRIMIATRNGGVLLSEDGCKSWQRMKTGSGAASFNTIALDLKNPDRIYAGTDNGAYISLDGGKTWNAVNDGLLGALVVYSIVVDPKDSTVYAATPYGIFKLEAR